MQGVEADQLWEVIRSSYKTPLNFQRDKKEDLKRTGKGEKNPSK